MQIVITKTPCKTMTGDAFVYEVLVETHKDGLKQFVVSRGLTHYNSALNDARLLKEILDLPIRVRLYKVVQTLKLDTEIGID